MTQNSQDSPYKMESQALQFSRIPWPALITGNCSVGFSSLALACPPDTGLSFIIILSSHGPFSRFSGPYSFFIQFSLETHNCPYSSIYYHLTFPIFRATLVLLFHFINFSQTLCQTKAIYSGQTPLRNMFSD